MSQRLQDVFSAEKRNGPVMSLFLTAGYPTIEDTADLLIGFEKAGADIVELGMPFSDPLADGPTIQYSSGVAIENGIDLPRIFETVKEVRKSSELPLVLMGYINPVIRFGMEKFCKQAAEAGADGLIIPDAPVEESARFEELARENGLDFIYLVAPNTSDERMQAIDKRSTGFVYCVSVTGVTGARTGEEVQKSVERFIGRVNENITENPVMIGFGIKNHQDAMNISKKSDGFIVGSALIENIRSNHPNGDWKTKVYDFVRELKFGSSN